MFEVSRLALRYPGSPPLLQGIDLRLEAGDILYLGGANGSGKTSLLNAISGIIPSHVQAELEGTISLDGKDLNPIPLRERFRWLSYQMSDPDTQIFFPRVEKELSFALENLGLPAAEIRARIDAAAGFFGLGSLLDREPATLSSGQKKLLLLAICDTLATPLVLLDEPSAGLGTAALEKLSAWLEHLRRQGRIVIMAEHNPALRSFASHSLDLGI